MMWVKKRLWNDCDPQQSQYLFQYFAGHEICVFRDHLQQLDGDKRPFMTIHPSLDGHWRFFLQHPTAYTVNINIVFGWGWRIHTSGGCRISPRWGVQHTILPNFPKNCIKLKEFGPRGTHASRGPLRSATAYLPKPLRSCTDGGVRNKTGVSAESSTLGYTITKL